jgi:integral membrane protein
VPSTSVLDFRSVEGALLRYRIMAIIVGISIIILVCIGIPLSHAGHEGINHRLGFLHGVIFYPLYILLTLDIGRRVRMHPIQIVLTMIAGTIPFVSFYAEHRTTSYVRERQAALAGEAVLASN